MGCDIHSFAERLNKQTNKWEKVGDAFSLGEYDKTCIKKIKEILRFVGEVIQYLLF